MKTLRIETCNGVGAITLTRGAEYNTITPELRDELAAAIDRADADHDVRVILLRAEGPAFCAGYALDRSTRAQSGEARAQTRVGLGRRLRDDLAIRQRVHEALVREETNYRRGERMVYRRRHRHGAMRRSDNRGRVGVVRLSAVARVGHADDRDVGVSDGPRTGQALPADRRRNPAPEAARIGLILETVPDDELDARAIALAERMAHVPTNQLQMLKLLCNHTAENMGLGTSRLVGSLFDGIARHTQEGLDFVARAQAAGFRQAVRERDDPFGDYGSGPRSKNRAAKKAGKKKT